MNSDEIRSIDISGAQLGSVVHSELHLMILREIAAQLADINETLKNKSLMATCHAHVHIENDNELGF